MSCSEEVCAATSETERKSAVPLAMQLLEPPKLDSVPGETSRGLQPLAEDVHQYSKLFECYAALTTVSSQSRGRSQRDLSAAVEVFQSVASVVDR